MIKVIGIGGFARSGKDAFVSIAQKILRSNNYYPQRFAFADTLKGEVGKMLRDNGFSLDVYTTNAEAKAKLRPLMVWWGCSRRDLSVDGFYWVNQVHKRLESIQNSVKNSPTDENEFVALISDVRFVNEAKWLHEKWGGQFIHLRRYSMKGSRDRYGDPIFVPVFDSAPNEEEAKNDPLIQQLADVKVEWESQEIPSGGCVTDDEYLHSKVLDALNSTKFFKHDTIGTLS